MALQRNELLFGLALIVIVGTGYLYYTESRNSQVALVSESRPSKVDVHSCPPPSPCPVCDNRLPIAESTSHSEVNIDKKPYAYATYATENQYFCSALLNMRRLADLNATFNADRVIIVPKGIKMPIYYEERANQLGVIIKVLPGMPAMRHGYYRHVLNKIHVFSLTEYKSVIHFDADGLILRPMNDLFYHEWFEDEFLIGLKNYWEYPLQKTTFTSMLLLVRPSVSEYEKLNEILDKVEGLESSSFFDMDLLNQVYWDSATLLSPYYGALSAHWCHNWVEPFKDLTKALHNEIKYVHFTGPGKMWSYPSPDVIYAICQSQLANHKTLEWRTKVPHEGIKELNTIWHREVARTCGDELKTDPISIPWKN